MKADKATLLIFVIILFHAVGLAGFSIPELQPLFLQIVPFHLLLMLVVICVSHDEIDPKFLLCMIAITVLGYGVEWLGIHRHFIFGLYTYGDTLGTKWNGVPLIIAVNWFLLVYATGVLLQRLQGLNVIARLIIGGFIMLVLDLIIEPIAARYDYWHWRYHGRFLTAPVSNYISWFIVSAIMLGIFEAFKFKKQNNVGIALLIAQFVFFILLYMI